MREKNHDAAAIRHQQKFSRGPIEFSTSYGLPSEEIRAQNLDAAHTLFAG